MIYHRGKKKTQSKKTKIEKTKGCTPKHYNSVNVQFKNKQNQTSMMTAQQSLLQKCEKSLDNIGILFTKPKVEPKGVVQKVEENFDNPDQLFALFLYSLFIKIPVERQSTVRSKISKFLNKE